MRSFTEVLKTWFGLPFTIVCGAVGCVMLPPAFSNTWRVVIFLGLLVCYAIGFLCGRNQEREKANARISGLVAKHDKRIDELESQIEGKDALFQEEREHEAQQHSAEIDRLKEEREHEVQDLNTRHAMELSEKNHEIDEKNHEIDRITIRLEAAEKLTMDEMVTAVKTAMEQQVESGIHASAPEGLSEDDMQEILSAMTDEKVEQIDAELEKQRSTLRLLSSREAYILECILDCEDRGKTYKTKERDAALIGLKDNGIVMFTKRDLGPFNFEITPTYECRTAITWRRAIAKSRKLISESAADARAADEERRRKDRAARAERLREQYRATARKLTPDNKLLLTALGERESVRVAIDEYRLGERLGDARSLVQTSAVGPGTYEITLSDEGRSVIENASDILRAADEENTYLWWLSDALPTGEEKESAGR